MIDRRVVVTAAVSLALLLPALPASADVTVGGSFQVSSVGTNNQITTGPDGNIWLTLDGAKDLARITPDGTVTEYDPVDVSNPTGITGGPDGNLWVTQNGQVVRVPPSNPNNAKKFTAAAISDARAITAGPDGNLWTASGDKVLRITTADPPVITAFSGTGVQGARWITAGSDSNLWVAGQDVVRVTTAGVGTPYPIGNGIAQGIAAGTGGQVAYSNPLANPQEIGRITDPGPAQKTAVPLADPFGVAFGQDGAYWFAQFAANSLGRLTADGQYSTLAVGAGTGPRQITAGPGDTLWVTLDLADKVARIDGVKAPVPDPGPNPNPTPAPTTKITKKPAKKVQAKGRRTKVRVAFTGTAGATFQCRVDKRAWRACTSPKHYRLAAGKHRIRVRAVLGGVKDASPAVARFRIRG